MSQTVYRQGKEVPLPVGVEGLPECQLRNMMIDIS
jgi:hypothetical protein